MADVKPACGGRGTPCSAAFDDRTALGADRGGAGFAPLDPEIPLTPPQAAVDEFIKSYKVESRGGPSETSPWMIPVVAVGTFLLSAAGALFAYRMIKRRRAAAAKETIPPLAEDVEPKGIDVPPPLASEPEPVAQPKPQPQPRPEPAIPPPLPPKPVAEPQPQPQPQPEPEPKPEPQPVRSAQRPVVPPPPRRKGMSVPRGGVFPGDNSATVAIPPSKSRSNGDSRSQSQSVTTMWDGTGPERGGAEVLLDGFDVELPESDLDFVDRITIPAPPPGDNPLAPLPGRERRWQPFAERADSQGEVAALVELAGELERGSLYSGLSREDIERRAQSCYDLWMDMPEEKRAELLVGVEPEEAFRVGETAIPHSWILKNEVVLNARLRLAENPIFIGLPDTYRSAFIAEGGLRSEGVDIPATSMLAVARHERLSSRMAKRTEIERAGKVETLYEIEHEGPGRHILRSAVAMIGNFLELADFVDDVLSRDGLAKLLMVHSDRSPVEKMAFRLGRLIEFSSLGKKQLELLGRRYISMWSDLAESMRRQIIYDDMVERGEARYETIEMDGDNKRTALKGGQGVPSRPVPFAGGSSAYVAKLNEPPGSWLSWQRRELRAWTSATNAASEAKASTGFDMRTIHRQLYNQRNSDFVDLAASDRYIVCKSIADAMELARQDAEFMREHVNARGFISPVGIELLKKLGGVKGSGLNFRVDRSRGLRMIEDRGKREERARRWEPKVTDWKRGRGGKSIK